jgi:hypothetical protein
MSSRAHARRRLAAWDRYRDSYRRSAAYRHSLRRYARVGLILGHADYQWWIRANRRR